MMKSSFPFTKGKIRALKIGNGVLISSVIHIGRAASIMAPKSNFHCDIRATFATAFLVVASALNALSSTLYVNVNNAAPAAPFTNWVSAATNIQQAVDAAAAGDDIVVTNGIYATGGRTLVDTTTNRVAVTKAVAIRSINGPQFTVIQGFQVPGVTNGVNAIRCVFLTNGASLSGFTLTNGATQTGGAGLGGGVRCNGATAVLTNCVLTGNASAFAGGGDISGMLIDCRLIGNSCWLQGGGAYVAKLINCTFTNNSAGTDGGGSYSGSLTNCILSGNSAGTNGGGSAFGTLNNCSLTGNSALFGGGCYRGNLNNCIIYFNSASDGANFHPQDQGGVLNNCCTTPLPTNGFVNITNAPLFVDYAGGNLRLQSTSPCINSGRNIYAPELTDKDGNPRVAGGTADIGAFEFQTPTSVLSYAWAQQYGLLTDGSVDLSDPDGDHMNNWQEWRCLTNPTNATSVLRLVSALPAGTNVTVTWQSVAGVNYFLERSPNLLFGPLATNLPGPTGTTTYTDTNAASASPLFYRVGVGN